MLLKNRITGEIIEHDTELAYNTLLWADATIVVQAEMEEMATAFKEEGMLLGDAVAKATKTIGFEPCPACKRRQEWLNEFHGRGRRFIRELLRKIKYGDIK